MAEFCEIFVAPVNPGFPHSTNLPFKTFPSIFLFFAISSRYLFQSENVSLGEFFEIFRNAMPVSVVVIVFPSITLACLNHLSDCESFIVLPSAVLSPNFPYDSNCSFKAALSTSGALASCLSHSFSTVVV
jgi:hypothetical protein